MAYKVYSTPDGDYCIDWDAVCTIIGAHARAQAVLRHATTVVERDEAGDFLWHEAPRTHTVKVNWDKVREEAAAETNSAGWRMAAVASFQSPENIIRELSDMQRKTRTARERFQQMQRGASERTMAEIEGAVAGAENSISVLKIVRDVSGSILIGAATGGGSLWVAGAGVAIKTIGKYQDTGRVGSAVVEAGLNIVFTMIPIGLGVQVAGKAKAVKVLLTAAADGTNAYLDGKSLAKSILIGSVALGSPLIEKVVKAIPADKFLSEAAVPVATAIASKVTSDQVKKQVQNQIKAAGGAANAKPGEGPSKDGISGIAETLVFEDALLLSLCIIDMDEGVKFRGH